MPFVGCPGEGTCGVHLQFTDGSSDAAQVRFKKMSGACGCYLGADVSSLEPTDAASD